MPEPGAQELAAGDVAGREREALHGVLHEPRLELLLPLIELVGMARDHEKAAAQPHDLRHIAHVGARALHAGSELSEDTGRFLAEAGDLRIHREQAPQIRGPGHAPALPWDAGPPRARREDRSRSSWAPGRLRGRT